MNNLINIKVLKTLSKKEQQLINGGQGECCYPNYTVTCYEDGTYWLSMPNTGYEGFISESRANQLCNIPQA